jgi:hypothetical protein
MNRYRQVPRVFLYAALAFTIARPARAQWAPPLGIPSPSFGIQESAPASPAPWVVETPGFYYVDATNAGASDTGNTFGTPGHPRSTIPSPVPAGSVVELHGVYDDAFTSPNTLYVQGTVDRPVFIRGVDASSRPQIRSPWEVKGTYAIFENLELAPADESRTGSLVFLAPSHHLALRSSDVHGNLSGGGLGVASWEDGSSINDVVISKNIVHDNGDVHADYDQDVHGITINERVSSVWVLDNELARNSGDGIQINAESAADQATTHHIYVGRNVAHHNKQTGFWVKQAVDVIFSENECFEHRPGNSSYGQCMGYQYATDRVWFLFNQIHDCDFGIGVSSDSDLGTGIESYFIGNLIYRIHHSVDGYNPDTGWSNAAIMLAGGTRRYVVNNTIYDVDAGINSPSVDGTLEIADNIIGKVAEPGNHIFIEIDSLASSTYAHHNLFTETPRLLLAGILTTPDSGQLANMASLAADPRFADADAGNFTIPTSSPAVNSGELNAVYDVFQRRYGRSIAVDILGQPRTGRARTDIGAYLGGGQYRPPASPAPSVPGSDPAPLPPTAAPDGSPGAPSDLQSLVLSRVIRLTWDPPSQGPQPTQYQIEVGTAPGRADLVLLTRNASTIYITLARSSGSVYVRVRGVTAAGTGPPSNEVNVTVR